MTSKYSDLVNPIINTLNIDDTKKNIIKGRFLNEVNLYDTKIVSVKKWYDFFRFTITMGSILLPALLSIGQMDPTKLPNNFDQVSYWGSWIISLTVTVSNGFLQLFSLDKNYFMYSLVSENLKTEGWQYFQLSGKYEDIPNHSAGYKIFCKSVESIKRKQIEQEYAGGKSADKKKKFNFSKDLNKNLPEQFKLENKKDNQKDNQKDNIVEPNMNDVVDSTQEVVVDIIYEDEPIISKTSDIKKKTKKKAIKKDPDIENIVE